MEDPQGSVIAGGNNINAFQKVYLGERYTHNNGISCLSVLKVEPFNLLSLMINYG
ncbi:hypothetical protein [Lysobacter enzymogenes]|uniref:hypothetical protein n=1 Tax=Lysobacter enzymogenes TaxID=69 RepID=UPI001A7E09A4|nr:hypothetical protein [Lysobacter enzymogenes]UZW61910.1 hypothetical protein BV903_006300 [Lysobacter enzymogenes]